MFSLLHKIVIVERLDGTLWFSHETGWETPNQEIQPSWESDRFEECSSLGAARHHHSTVQSSWK